jgi:hypothetical protein
MAAKRHNVDGAETLFFKENTKEYNKYPQICIAAIHKMRTMMQ